MYDTTTFPLCNRTAQMGPSVIAVFHAYAEARNAMKRLHQAEFDMSKLSVIHKDDSAFFVVPGIGPIMVGGPLVGWLIDALEGGMTAGGGMSAVGAALYNLGIPKDSSLRYENSLKANKVLVIAHGATGEVVQARDIFLGANSIETNVHRIGPAGTKPDGDGQTGMTATDTKGGEGDYLH